MRNIDGATAFAQLVRDWSGGPVFHVPGEGILDVLDALAAAEVPMISCRHEAGAAVAAQAAGRMTHRPGICLVGRAPGALNTALALHTARTDAAPMILIVGQPSRRIAGREPFLGDEFGQTFAPMAKWAGICTSADQVVAQMSRAWDVAMRGQRGPTVLAVHEEVWAELLSTDDLPATPPQQVRAPAPEESVTRMIAALGQAERPMILVGGTNWTEEDAKRLAQLADATGVPVATSYRRRDLMPSSHPLFVGEVGIGADPTLLTRIAEADCLLVLGMRLGEINTFGAGVFEGYRLLDAPIPVQPVFHVHPDPAELNAVYRTAEAICADAGHVVHQMLERSLEENPRGDWAHGARQARVAFTEGSPGAGSIDLREVFRDLRDALPDNAVLTVGAGAYAHWPQRYFPHERYGTQLGPKSGAMGYGLPAAIGAQATCPDRPVVAVAGDGCFSMQGEELATAVLYRLPIVVIVINNALYGAIAASQSRMFGRRTGVHLAPVDYAGLARSMGANGYRVRTTREFAPALRNALSAEAPTLIEILTTEEALKP